MDDLIKQAEELGIKIDGRWSESRLQQEIDNVLAGVKTEPDQKLFPVKLLKNYRPIGAFKVQEKDEIRDPGAEEVMKAPAGLIIHLPVEEARAVIGKKIAVRDDPIG